MAVFWDLHRRQTPLMHVVPEPSFQKARCEPKVTFSVRLMSMLLITHIESDPEPAYATNAPRGYRLR